MRGKQSPAIKKSDDIRKSVIEHINSFPRVPSHYCRKDSKKEYLTSDLNISKMYQMYLENCKSNNIIPEKESFYRNILTKEFNIGFHVPRKDQCDKCYVFERLSAEDQEENREKHSNHLERKNQARSLRDSFKEKAQRGECYFIQFDLEAVRYCPANLNTKKFYYKRRLAVYNLTMYNVATTKAENFMWHEGIGGRGSTHVEGRIET
ncbi:uncharacterized protein LOC120354498 [Nilaparvata lugens]|uniref:uncharacterized protein LOC120354498 n=1 Tax=Nilaparvata lugens TaxID=108931 RepID=UPI00193CB6C4|nr:uncharacterized protein LOC120354498 [Nilaparvata lugens]